MTNVSRTYVHTSHTKEYLSTYVLERPVEYCQRIIEHFFIHVNPAKKKKKKIKPQILENFTRFLTNYVARGNFGEFNACELRRF